MVVIITDHLGSVIDVATMTNLRIGRAIGDEHHLEILIIFMSATTLGIVPLRPCLMRSRVLERSAIRGLLEARAEDTQ